MQMTLFDKDFLKKRMIPIFILLFGYLLQPSVNAGVLMLSPSGSIYKYVNKQTSFTCSHSHNLGIEVQWIINVNSTVEGILRHFRVIEEHPSFSVYIITNVQDVFNGTEIQCSANTTDGEVLYSDKAKLILQSTLTEVEDLSLRIEDYSLLLSWSAPYALIGGNQIQYVISIENLTETNSIMNVTTQVTYYELNSLPYRRIACDDFRFSIIPENAAGLGESHTINYENEGITIIDRTLILNNMQYYDVILLLTAPLCKIQYVKTFNKNFNETEFLEENFNSFTLINSTEEEYQYILNLNLHRRFQYELNLSLTNPNNSTYLKFIISTHAIRNADIIPTSPKTLNIKLHYNSHNEDNRGAFLSLFHCKTNNCDDFYYNNSLYLSISGSDVYNLTYVAGTYLVYAYDVDAAGTLLPSFNNTCFSVFSKKVNLSFGRASSYYVMDSKSYCQLIYINDTIGVECNPEFAVANPQIKKQVILQELEFGELIKILISDSTMISQPSCLKVEDKTYYGIITVVSNFPAKRKVEPIGCTIVSSRQEFSNYTTSGLCNPCVEPFSTDSENPGVTGDIIGIIIGTVLMILLAVMIFFTVTVIFLYSPLRNIRK